VLFEAERPLLKPLPAIAPDLGSWHRVVVHRDCHVQHDRAFYSVPFTLAGKALWLRATDTTIAIHEDWRHVVTHARARRAGARVTLRDHLPPAARNFFERDRQWCCKQAQAIGAQCAALIERLLSDRISERLRAAQGVLALAKRYGAQRVEVACARALVHDSPHYRTVKTILSTGADLQPMVQPQTPAAYARSRFVRSAAALFAGDDLFDNDPSSLH
jgi:hypothetical protein